MQHDDMIQCAVQGCGRRQGVLLQVDVLCWARSLHILFIIQLKGFAAKQNGAVQPLSKPIQSTFEIWICFSKVGLLKATTKKYSSPHWLCNSFSGIFWDKHMAGKSVIGWVLRNKTEIPADGGKKESIQSWRKFTHRWNWLTDFLPPLCVHEKSVTRAEAAPYWHPVALILDHT